MAAGGVSADERNDAWEHYYAHQDNITGNEPYLVDRLTCEYRRQYFAFRFKGCVWTAVVCDQNGTVDVFKGKRKDVRF